MAARPAPPTAPGDSSAVAPPAVLGRDRHKTLEPLETAAGACSASRGRGRWDWRGAGASRLRGGVRVRLVRGRDETRPVGTGEGRDASG